MRPRGRYSIVANPMLVGAVTVLIAVIAVYLSYGANSGVPFVPTYEVTLDVPSAVHLTKDADVRMGGTRIGQVSSAEALAHPDGVPTARLHLKLVKSVEPLPSDTRFRIQPVSNTGLDFVDVYRGRSKIPLDNAVKVPARQILGNVPLEDFLSTFDAPTRAGMRAGLAGAAYGFAGRGTGLNDTLVKLVPLLTDLTPAMRLLSAPDTGLGRFVTALSRLSSEVAPVADEQANGFTELRRTFDGLSQDPRALADVIEQSPPNFDAVVRDAPAIQTFLRSSTRFSAALQPAALALPRAGASLARGLDAGARGLPATRRLLPRVDDAVTHVADFASDTGVQGAVDRLSLTGRTLAPLTRFLLPAQSTCEYGALLLRNLASALKEGPTSGTALRVVIIAVTAARDAEAGIASAPSDNKDAKGLGALHSNPYPNTAAPGQPHECEAGQEPFLAGQQVIGNVPSQQDATTESPK